MVKAERACGQAGLSLKIHQVNNLGRRRGLGAILRIARGKQIIQSKISLVEPASNSQLIAEWQATGFRWETSLQ